jgi:hypothetical protein
VAPHPKRAGRDLFLFVCLGAGFLIRDWWHPEQQFQKHPGPPRRSVTPEGAIRAIRTIRFDPYKTLNSVAGTARRPATLLLGVLFALMAAND